MRNLLALALLCLPTTRAWTRVNPHIVDAIIHLSGGARYDDDDKEQRRPSQRRPTQKRPKIHHKAPSTLGRLARQSLSIGSKSLSLTTSAVQSTASATTSAAYHLLRPKHVLEPELYGLWRLDQQVTWRGKAVEASVAIELTKNSQVVVVDGEETSSSSPFYFTPSKFGKSARVEFDAKAFAVEGRPPVEYRYRGYIHRKLADPSVIKIVGKIYRLEAAGWRGRAQKQVLVGTFVARRRMKLQDENEDWYDDEEEEEEHDWGDEEEDEYDKEDESYE